MPDPRVTWTIGISSLFLLFPFACRVLDAAFDGGIVVMILPLAFYYMLPATLFGGISFSDGTFGPSPQTFVGHVLAALVWGVIGATIGFFNGRWHYKRQRTKRATNAGTSN